MADDETRVDAAWSLMKGHRREAAEFIAWLIADPLTRHILLHRICRECEPQSSGEAVTV